MDPLMEPEHEHPEHGDSTELHDEIGSYGFESGLEPPEPGELHLAAFDEGGGIGMDAAHGVSTPGDAHLAESLGLDPAQLGIERTTPSDHGPADFYAGRPSEDSGPETAQDHPPMSAESGMTAQPAGLLHQQPESSGQLAAPPGAAPGTEPRDGEPSSIQWHYADEDAHHNSPPGSATAPAQTPEAQLKGAGQASAPTGSSSGTGSVAAGAAPDASQGGSDQLQALGQQELSKEKDAQETSQLLNDISNTKHEINMGIINNIR